MNCLSELSNNQQVNNFVKKRIKENSSRKVDILCVKKAKLHVHLLDKAEVQLGFDLLDDRVLALPTKKFIDGES